MNLAKYELANKDSYYRVIQRNNSFRIRNSGYSGQYSISSQASTIWCNDRDNIFEYLYNIKYLKLLPPETKDAGVFPS